MNGIREWSAVVCLAALGCSALRLLAPKTGNGTLFRLITVSFFLCILVMPLMKITVSDDLPITLMPPDITDSLLEQRVNEQLQRQVREAVESVVTEALTMRDIVAKKIAVETDIDENGSIYIQRVTVYVDKQTVPIAMVVREVLEQQLQTAVVVKTEE